MSIIDQILVGFISSTITLIGSLLLYGPKLRKEQKSDFQRQIGEKKASALLKLKDIINDCGQYDFYIEEEAIEKNVICRVIDQGSKRTTKTSIKTNRSISQRKRKHHG